MAGARFSCALGLTLVAASAWAQDPAVTRDAVMRKGFHSGRSYFSPESFEHFDPVSGNLVLSFVDLELPGNAGQSLRFQRTYNAQIREPGQRSRWTFGLAGLVMRVKERPLPPTTFVFDGTVTQMLLSTPSFYMADGGIHPTLYLTTPFPSQPPATPNWSLATVTTADFIRYDRSTGTMKYPNGIVAHYNSAIAADRSIVGDGRLLDYSDPFGNVVSLNWTGTALVVTQSLGDDAPRVITLELDADGLPTELTYGSDGRTRTWTYEYELAGSPAGVQTDLKRVTPPSGVGWTYGYDADHLRWLSTPHGGRIDYGYEYRTVSVGPHPEDVEEFTVLVSRTTSESTAPWTIAMDFDSLAGFSRVTTIGTPTGTGVEYRHLPQGAPAGRLLSGIRLTEHYVRDAGGIALQHESRTYQLVPAVYHSPTSWWGTTEILERRVTRDNQDYVTVFSYDLTPSTLGGFHNLSGTTESSAGQNRITTYTYRNYGYPYWSSGLFLLGRLQSEQVQVGSDTWVRRWTYDGSGFAIEARDWASVSENLPIVTTYTRDPQGNVATMKMGSGEPTSYVHQYGRIRQIRTPEHTTQRVINADGTLQSDTQAGRTTTYAHDALGRLVTLQPPGGVAPTRTTHDPAGRWVRVTRGGDFTEATLDGFGRAIATVDGLGIQTRTVYDAEGRITGQSMPFLPGVGAGDVRETFAYDALGRERARTHPDGATVRRAYGPGTVTITDENGVSTLQAWQAFGDPDDARLTTVVDGASQTWTYGYDALDRLRSVLAPDGTQRRWEYNSRNRLASEAHPESGTVVFESYDYQGRLTRKRDARGTVFDYGYDANDRVSSVASGSPDVGGERVTRFGYEPGSDRRVWASVGYRDVAGAVLDAVDTQWVYDAAGRLEARQDALDGRTFTSWYTRDAVDNVTTLTYPSLEVSARRQVGYSYDVTGRRLTGVVDRGTTRSYASEFDYHASGGLTKYRGGNNLLTLLTYDPLRYWVRGVSAGPLSLAYTTYDPAGNLTRLTDGRANHNQTFGYDALNRLVSASGAYGGQSFTYDAHGNRTSIPGLATYAYDATTLRLMAQNGVEFSYDANGNLLTQIGRTYDYTVDNALETANVGGVVTTYRYDADGWRISRRSGGVTSYVLRGPAGELLTEWTSPGPSGSTRDYIYAGQRLVSAVVTGVASASLPTGILVLGGAPASVTVSAGQDARYTFAGSAGQTVQVQLTHSSPLACNWTLAILTPTGLPLGSDTPCTGSRATVNVTLPAAGVYTVLVDPSSGTSGTVTLVVTNTSSGTPAITGLSPAVAAPGTTVTVQGTGLASALNVRFNSIDAAVASATATSLTALVPAGAVSGHVAVTTPTGTATSVADLFVPPAPFTAAQVVTTGRLAVGVPRAVTLATPGTIALLLLDRVAGQRFLTIGTSPTSVLQHVTMLRPDGEVLSTRGPWYSPTAIQDALTAPTTGTYTFLIEADASALGTKTYTVFDVPPDLTGTIGVTCAPVPVGVLTPGQNARLTMHGTAGQRVAMVVDAKTITALGATLAASDGSVVWYAPIYTPGAEAYAIVTLPLTGTYSLLLNPWYDYSGAITWRACDVPPDHLVPAGTAGVPVTVIVTAPYQNGVVQFTAAAGQHVTVTTPTSTFPTGCVYVRLYSPSSSQVAWDCASGTAFIDHTATESGVYTVLVDPVATATGSVTVRVSTISDLSGTITAGGSAVTATTTVPGQNATYAFTGTSGQKVALHASSGTFGGTFYCDAYVRILKPDGTTLAPNVCAEATGFIDATVLPVSGSYKIVLDPQGTATGSVTLRLYRASDVVGTLPSGTPKVITTGIGQNARYTFSASAGSRLSLRTSSATYGADCNAYLQVLKPDGMPLVSAQCAGAAPIFIDATTLPTAGTYTAVIDPVAVSAGSVTVTRYSVPGDPNPVIQANQPPATVTTTVPGQNAAPRYGGTAGQTITVRLSANALGTVTVSLVAPGTNGAVLISTTSSAASFNLPSQTLPVNGIYTIRIDASGPTTGSIGVQVTIP
jgi:YD repeat-containing protein